MSDDRIYTEPVNGIAEAVDFPEAGEEITIRKGIGKVTVERVDRRHNQPIMLEDSIFPAVTKRMTVEYSKRVEQPKQSATAGVEDS